MTPFLRGGEFGSRTPYESRTTETKQATLKYDVGKPLLLSLVIALATMLFVLSVLWAVKALGRHVWYVAVVVAAFGNCAWAVLMGRKNDSAFALTAFIFGVGFGIVFCIGSVVLDKLVTHYWRELLLSVLPLTFCTTFLASIWLPNLLEAVLVSPHLEQALAVIVGGHDDKYIAPWWLQLYANRQPEPQALPPDEQPITFEFINGNVIKYPKTPFNRGTMVWVARILQEEPATEATLCGRDKPLRNRDELNALKDWCVKYGLMEWDAVRQNGEAIREQGIHLTENGRRWIADNGRWESDSTD